MAKFQIASSLLLLIALCSCCDKTSSFQIMQPAKGHISRHGVRSSPPAIPSSTSSTALHENKHAKNEDVAIDCQGRTLDRRSILQTIATSSVLFNLGICATPQNAVAAQTAGEAIRRSAANIPGYGQPDIFFPSSFIGKWKATRTIVASDDPYISQLAIPIAITHDVRFITVDGDGGGAGAGAGSGSDDKVISDRKFNEASYYNAIKAEVEKKNQDQSQDPSQRSKLKVPPSIQSINWSPFNPNVCTSNYSDGSSREVKVTKRAAELDADADAASSSGIILISSSEYRRITTVSSGSYGGIPSISASRVLTKWKSEGNVTGKDQVVEGIEITYTDNSLGGDPMSMSAGMGGASSAKPQMTSKCRLRLERNDDNL